jgi:hypothetical protein
MNRLPTRQLINYSKAIGSHVRDITVIYTVDDRIFFDIPLTFEKGMIFKEARIEGDRMIIKALRCNLEKSSHTNNDERLV